LLEELPETVLDVLAARASACTPGTPTTPRAVAAHNDASTVRVMIRPSLFTGMGIETRRRRLEENSEIPR
jgi:hypothetical protein